MDFKPAITSLTERFKVDIDTKSTHSDYCFGTKKVMNNINLSEKNIVSKLLDEVTVATNEDSYS